MIRSDETAAGAETERGRVVLVSFAASPSERRWDYLTYLLDRGIRVELLVLHPDVWSGLGEYPDLHIHSLKDYESRFVFYRVEQLILFDMPGKLLSLASKAARRLRLRPLDPIFPAIGRGHRKVARAIHKRIYMPVHRWMRPTVIAMLARKKLAEWDSPAVERVVAMGVEAIPLAWQVAKRHPRAAATTALDRTAYAALPVAARPDGRREMAGSA